MANVKQDRNIAEPPKWADRFFGWYCNPDLQEELLGDLYERFHEKVQNKGVRHAQFWYWINVFLFINKYTLRRDRRHSFTRLNTLDMFQNYFKTGFRNITKNGLSTFINAFGMALAIGCCLVVFRFVDWSFNTDYFHENRDEIYVIERNVNENGNVSLWGGAPEPLGAALKSDFPQVTNFTRTKDDGGIFQFEERVFSDWVTFVDGSFYEMFDFPVKYGNESEFDAPDGIVLTERAAEKYFGDTNPVGKELSIRFNRGEDEQTELFTVKGVFEKIPSGASFFFNALIPYERQLSLGKTDFNDWTGRTSKIFIQIPDKTAVNSIESDAEKYLTQINAGNESRKTESFNFQPLKRITMHAFDVRNSGFFTTHIAGFYMLGMIAVSLLLLVCFNYMNIAIASASTRMKEISVRKVIGGSRQQIIMQFLTENLIICVLAMLLGVLLARSFFLPWFASMGDIDLTLNFADSPQLWLTILGLVLITALGGAGYPALYISKLQPVSIFKNKMKLGGKNRFRKFLLGVQFFLTFITIFSVIAVLFETKEIRERSWGYNFENILNLDLKHGGDYEQIRNELLKHKDVLEITGSTEATGGWQSKLNIKVEGKELTVEGLTVDANYPELFGLKITEGRSFDKNKELDKSQSVLVNTVFRKQMGWESAVNKTIQISEQNYYVIGELPDYHYEAFDQDIKPLVVRQGKPVDFRYVAIRTASGEMTESAKAFKTVWQKMYPTLPYNYYFQDGIFDGYFRGYEQLTKILSATSLMTVIICSMGLFGLAMLLLMRRMKEVSIRKILGASMSHLSWRINKEFFVTIIISSALAAPVGWFLINSLLNLVAPGTTLGVLPFILTVIALITLTLISISKHIYSLSVSDPTRFLREE